MLNVRGMSTRALRGYPWWTISLPERQRISDELNRRYAEFFVRERRYRRRMARLRGEA